MTTPLLLAVDVGNTQTVAGLYAMDAATSTSDTGLVVSWRLSTVADRTTDELASMFAGLFSVARVELGAVAGLVVAAGVPRAKSALLELAERYFDFEPVFIGPGVRTGMPILYDNPKEVGADRIANSIGAYELYGGPAIVVDFGTGNNYDIVSADGEFIGGAIAPGIEVSMDALTGRAAALGSIDLVEPRSVIGKSTTEALQSGAVYGFAASVEGMVDRFQAALGGGAVVVATGGLAPVIAPVSSCIDHVDPYLTLHGLRIVHSRNNP